MRHFSIGVEYKWRRREIFITIVWCLSNDLQKEEHLTSRLEQLAFSLFLGAAVVVVSLVGLNLYHPFCLCLLIGMGAEVGVVTSWEERRRVTSSESVETPLTEERSTWVELSDSVSFDENVTRVVSGSIVVGITVVRGTVGMGDSMTTVHRSEMQWDW